MKYNPSANEIDYRYSRHLKNVKEIKNFKDFQESNINMQDNIDKMKKIGKIYSEAVTVFPNKASSKVYKDFNGLRLESLSNFTSTFANNCVTKGKWFYEVKLVTNRLFQLGWVNHFYL